jgi:hypothetical protein
MRDTCPHCGSKKIISDLPISVRVWNSAGGAGDGTAAVHVPVHATAVKDLVSGSVTVRLCGECGHAELQVSNFRALYEKYEQTRHS